MGSPARSALRLVVSQAPVYRAPPGPAMGLSLGSAPVVPAIGYIAIPGLRTRGPQLRPRYRGRRLPALHRVQI